MILNYFSPAHIITAVTALLLVLILYFIFKKKSYKAQRALVLVLVLANLFQHLFKLEIYPMYGGGFGLLCTAYNMCALLIILSPLAYFTRFKLLRDFVYYIGSSAGLVAILIPYWNIGDSIFTWEFFRFFFCHALLFASSVLPLLFGHHKPSWRRFLLLGISFFLGILLILTNDAVFFAIDLGSTDFKVIYEKLAVANPIWAFGPPEEFSFVVRIASRLSPSFLFESKAGNLVPVLWYLIPFYFGISIVALAVFALSDRARFVSDMKAVITKILSTFKRKKGD